jgi:hypothetical protein
LGPARIIAIINSGDDIKHLILDSFVSFFFGVVAVETFAQSSFYTQIFLHREVCAQKTFVHRRLHTQKHTFFFAKKNLYTQMLCTKMLSRT